MAATAGDTTASGGATSASHGGASRVLHNFSLPPRLSWGRHRLLRCSKSTATSSGSLSPPMRHRESSHSLRRVRNDGDQISVVGEKLLIDFRSEVERMRTKLLPETAVEAVSLAPWNFRTRRAACGEEKRTVASPVRNEVVVVPVRDGPRAKFSVALTRQEVEDDFVAMTGRRPPRKPKKRPRYVQKPMETAFPGLWLSEINADMYKVNEMPEPPK